jgi:hypothetical protein
MNNPIKHVQELDPRDDEQTAWVTATKKDVVLGQLTLTDFTRKVKSKKSFGGQVKIGVVQKAEVWAIEVTGTRIQRNEALVCLTDRLSTAGYTWAFTIDDFNWLLKV